MSLVNSRLRKIILDWISVCRASLAAGYPEKWHHQLNGRMSMVFELLFCAVVRIVSMVSIIGINSHLREINILRIYFVLITTLLLLLLYFMFNSIFLILNLILHFRVFDRVVVNHSPVKSLSPDANWGKTCW